MLLWGARVGLGDAYRTLLEMVLGFPQRSPWRWDYAVHQRLCWNYFFPCLSLSLESYACKYRDLTFKIRFKTNKKKPCLPFTDLMVLCHPNGKEGCWPGSSGACPSCWHQLCSALGQQAPGLPVCGMNSKWRTTPPEFKPAGCHMDNLWDPRNSCCMQESSLLTKLLLVCATREDVENYYLNEPACLSTDVCVQTPPGFRGACFWQARKHAGAWDLSLLSPAVSWVFQSQ